MAIKGWDESYSVGVPEMDQDHQKLVGIISQLHHAMTSGKSNTIMADLIREMETYAQSHFKKEEQFMAQIQYPHLDEQKKQHLAFLEKVKEFKQNYENGKINLAMSMMPFLNDWLMNHIMKVDKRYGPL